MSKPTLIDSMVDDFLRWPLPDSVCADGCATKQGPGRVGTNLLSAVEAKAMFEAIVQPKIDAMEDSTIHQRDEAENAADKLASIILNEPIDWPDHSAKWEEAADEARGEVFNAQWYPVREMLPDQGKTILFAWVRSKGSQHTMRTGYVNARGICVPGLTERWKTQPTHWRELPALNVIEQPTE